MVVRVVVGGRGGARDGARASGGVRVLLLVVVDEVRRRGAASRREVLDLGVTECDLGLCNDDLCVPTPELEPDGLAHVLLEHDDTPVRLDLAVDLHAILPRHAHLDLERAVELLLCARDDPDRAVDARRVLGRLWEDDGHVRERRRAIAREGLARLAPKVEDGAALEVPQPRGVEARVARRCSGSDGQGSGGV